MPRQPTKRRYRRKAKYMRKGRKPRANRVGVINLTRKVAENNVYNNAVAGTATGSGTVVLIGTPYQTPAFAGSSYYNIPFSAELQLLDVINHTELTALADRYKINWVKIKVYSTSNTASSGGTSQLPSILWCIDEDDAGMPASSTAGLNSIREKMSSKYRQFKQDGGGITIMWKPKIAGDVGNAVGTATGANVMSAPFLNSTFDNIPHYGVKGYLQDVNLTATPAVYSQFKFDISASITLKDIQ